MGKARTVFNKRRVGGERDGAPLQLTKSSNNNGVTKDFAVRIKNGIQKMCASGECLIVMFVSHVTELGWPWTGKGRQGSWWQGMT